MILYAKVILEVIKMNNSQNTYLTSSQLTLTLKSVMVGIEIMYLPNNVIKIAKQDGWISCILGAFYPLIIVFIATYLCKKYPKDNILILSKKCFGNFFGTVLNLIFISFFLFMLTSELAGYSNVFRIYSTSFLKNYQIILTVLIPIAFAAYKGLKPIGRLNEVGFYVTIALIILPIGILAYGSLLNMMPVFGSGFSNILGGVKGTTFSYSGMELLLLIYPFLQDKKKLFKCGIGSLLIVTFIYTWVVFGTIYYLGIETSEKYLWPVLTLTDSINIPIINSFRFVFMTLWSIVEFKCIATHYFAVTYGLNQSMKKISGETFTLLLYPLIIFLASQYGNPTTFTYYTDKLASIYIIFNISFALVLSIFIFFKKDGSYENT